MLDTFGRRRAGLLCPLALGLAVVLAGCGKASAPAPTPTPWIPTATVAGAPTSSPSATASSGGGTTQLSFKKDIEPIFQAHCVVCHIQAQLGGLNLSTYHGLIQGGNIVPGSIVTPGNHANSILYKIISPNGPWPGGNRMPLNGPYLDTATINTIATWIDQGAKDN
ncbi:MAG TPA: cytochrome c [Chloroflexota bacterium]|jgi:hypothetical protein|nr:cytochrome c [Chloroflexota bacterium]